MAAYTRPLIKIEWYSFVRMIDGKNYLLELGVKLVKKRTELSLSQQELADNANIAKSTIQRIEKGELNPTILMLHQICDAMGIDICELLKIG